MTLRKGQLPQLILKIVKKALWDNRGRAVFLSTAAASWPQVLLWFAWGSWASELVHFGRVEESRNIILFFVHLYSESHYFSLMLCSEFRILNRKNRRRKVDRAQEAWCLGNFRSKFRTGKTFCISLLSLYGFICSSSYSCIHQLHRWECHKF